MVCFSVVFVEVPYIHVIVLVLAKVCDIIAYSTETHELENVRSEIFHINNFQVENFTDPPYLS